MSILITSILMTACAGNNIKQQENPTGQPKPSNNIEVSHHSEITLSDFPVESATTSETTTDKESKSNQPKIKVVNFTFDKFEITGDNKNLLKQHAEFLIANPSYVLSVNGHSDYRGPELYNEKLSLRRANTVASTLISYGAPESQLIINSFGSSKPVEDYDNWFQNRRVELEYSELYMVSK